MKVVDASIVVQLVCFDLEPDRVGDEELAAPHLIDSEVLNALRRNVQLGDLTEARAEQGLGAFEDLAIARFPTAPLRRRIWELRDNLSAYDATYVALTEALRATSMLTSDDRIARVPGLRCRIEVV